MDIIILYKQLTKWRHSTLLSWQYVYTAGEHFDVHVVNCSQELGLSMMYKLKTLQ